MAIQNNPGMAAVMVCASMLTALSASAHAEWSGKIATGAKHMLMQEYDYRSVIVTEKGWLPGVEATLGYGGPDWQMFGHGAWYRNDIDYRGRLQNGQPFNTNSNTDLLQWSTGVRHRFVDSYWLRLTAEYDRWQREIKGRDNVAGLKEITHSHRIGLDGLYVGSTKAGEITAAIGLYRAQPEHLRVNFSGALDPISFKTRAATGYRLAFTFAPRILENLEIGAAFDRTRIGRSQPVGVARDGVSIGTITQPEHDRRHLTITVGYRF